MRGGDSSSLPFPPLSLLSIFDVPTIYRCLAHPRPGVVLSISLFSVLYDFSHFPVCHHSRSFRSCCSSSVLELQARVWAERKMYLIDDEVRLGIVVASSSSCTSPRSLVATHTVDQRQGGVPTRAPQRSASPSRSPLPLSFNSPPSLSSNARRHSPTVAIPLGDAAQPPLTPRFFFPPRNWQRESKHPLDQHLLLCFLCC